MNKLRALSLGLSLITALFFSLSFVCADEQEAAISFKVAPSVAFPIIDGDKEKFEEDHWMSRNPVGGATEFTYSKHINDTDSLEMDGRAIVDNNDYSFDAEFIREGVGSILFEFEEYRKYYDGTGGYTSVNPRALSSTYSRIQELDTDLHLDIGNFKLEGILAKEDLPVFTLAYEREYKDGAKSLTSWSSVDSGGSILDPLTYPTFLELDEIVDIFEIGIEDTVKNVDVSLDQTFEHVKIEMQKVNNLAVSATGTLGTYRQKYEDIDFDQYTTIARLAKDWNNDVFSSFGLMFNHYIGGSIEAITDQSTSGYNERHPWNPASIEQNSLVLVQSNSFSPLKDIFVDAGLKAEIINKNGASRYDRDIGTTAVANGTRDEERYIKSEVNTKKFAESIKLKCNKIRDMVFYVEADFEQEFIGQYESQVSLLRGPDLTSISDFFTRDTDAKYYDNDYSLGFKWYPQAKLNLTAQYKFKQSNRDYEHKEKTDDAVSGYSAFIETMNLESHLPSIKLQYKPLRWVAYNLGYIYDTTFYDVRTFIDSDTTEIARSRAHMYSADVTLTPYDYFYLTLFYQRTNASTATNARTEDVTSANRQPTYNANFDTLSLICNYAPTDKTVFKAGYSMYTTDNFDDYTSTSGNLLPLGLKNLSQDISIGLEHKLNDNRSVEFKYDFMKYDEDSNGGADDYDAHLIYAGMNIDF